MSHDDPKSSQETGIEADIDYESSLIIRPGKYVYIAKAPPIRNLVFSGGGAKGAIYPGVIKALEEHRSNIHLPSVRQQIHHVAASSIGAVVGALFACGMSSTDFIEKTKDLDFENLLGKGLLGTKTVNRDGKPLLHFLEKNIAETVKKVLVANDITQTESFQLLTQQEKARVRELQNLLNEQKNPTVSITFSMLNILAKLDRDNFKELSVTAVCKETGKLYIFNAENSPDLDIATACRASASLPIILQPVKIKAALAGGEGEGELSFVDGGFIDNVPVSAVENRQRKIKGLNEGEQKQNLQTLAFVFDENISALRKKAGAAVTVQSPFHDHDPTLQHELYYPSKKDRFSRNVLAGRVVKTPKKATEYKASALRTIRDKYTQRNIPLDVVGIKTTDFKAAKAKSEELIANGVSQTETYLANHDREAVYISADTPTQFLLDIPLEKLKALKPVADITEELIYTVTHFRIEVENIVSSTSDPANIEENIRTAFKRIDDPVLNHYLERVIADFSPVTLEKVEMKSSNSTRAIFGKLSPTLVSELKGPQEGNVISEQKQLFHTLPAPKKRATIGIRCADIETGAEFYRAVQELMAQLYPREYDRPKIFLDLGGTDENASAMLGAHRKKFDVILVPHKNPGKEGQAEDFPAMTPQSLIHSIYPASVNHLEVKQAGSSLFADYGVKIVDQTTFQHRSNIRPGSAVVVGVVGGMGPEADGYTLQCLAKAAKHHDTAKQLRVYLMSDPRVPRVFSQKIKANKLKSYKARLKKFLGIYELDTVIVPSNTFHTGIQYRWAQAVSHHKILSIIDSVENEARNQFQGKKIGLLATSTTAKSGIYRDRLTRAGATVIQPDEALQATIDLGIKAMKGGDITQAREHFVTVIKELKKQKADVILLGCTEIPLALENFTLPTGVTYVDSADILGRAVVAHSKHVFKEINQPLIQCVSNALTEYVTANRDNLYKSSFHEGIDRANRLLVAMKAASSTPKNYEKLVSLVNDITSGADYHWLHRPRKGGLDAVLIANMEAANLPFKTKRYIDGNSFEKICAVVTEQMERIGKRKDGSSQTKYYQIKIQFEKVKTALEQDSTKSPGEKSRILLANIVPILESSTSLGLWSPTSYRAVLSFAKSLGIDKADLKPEMAVRSTRHP